MHPHNDPLDTFRASDGTLCKRVTKYPHTNSPQSIPRPLTHGVRSSAATDKVRMDAATNNFYRPTKGRDLGSPRDIILPSIEGSQPAAAPSYGRVVSVNRFSLPSMDDSRAIITDEDVQRRVDDIEILDLTDDTRYTKKRRRMDDLSVNISKSSRTGTLATNVPLQQRGLESISLHSPAEQNLHQSNSNALSASRYQSSHDHSNVPTSTPTYYENPEFSTFGAVSRPDEMLVARRPAGQLSGMSHFPSREVFYQSTSSPRRDDDSDAFRLHPAFSRGATPVDRGIQEYRAFRARERQERALLSPSRRGRPLNYENSDASHATTEFKSGRSRHFDEAGSLYGPSHQLPLQGFTRELSVVDESIPLAREDQHPLRREKPAERDHPLRRRSASPVGHLRSTLSFAPANSQSQRGLQPEVAAEYLPMDWDREIHRGARLERVFVAPTRR
jgi:hypothetical protein